MLAYIGLGSNLGDRERHLDEGLRSMIRRGLPISAISSIWETEPVDTPEPLWFLNMVARAEWEDRPGALLGLLQETEREAGRVRSAPNAPRVLDLDLLLIGDLTIVEPGLTIPHPRMWERSFVLAPLAELAPELAKPGTGRTVSRILADLDRPSIVRRIGTLALPRAHPL